jgi:Ca2+-transporting ATPase
MGKGGTEVAQSMSDIVLKEDNLADMVYAVGEGRRVYGNIRKSIEYLLSTNFSEIEVMLVATAAGMPAPLNASQLLWLNLLTDVFPSLALGMEPASADVMKRPTGSVGGPMLSGGRLKRLGMQSVSITGATMLSYWYGLRRYGPGAQASTHAFMTLTLAQLVQSFSSRSETKSVLNPRDRMPANHLLTAGVGVSMVLQFAAILVPGLRNILGTSRLGVIDLAVVSATAVSPFFIHEVQKLLAKPPKTVAALPPAEAEHVTP